MMQLIPDLPAAAYHAHGAMSKGKLDWFDDSPARYAYIWHIRLHLNAQHAVLEDLGDGDAK